MKRIIHTIITLAVSLASANAQISGEIKKRGKMFIVRHVSATYDKESNTLTVDNETYPVRDNPYYGNTDDKRGAYRYVADGRFYFD